jgi:hypothetical protein
MDGWRMRTPTRPKRRLSSKEVLRKPFKEARESLKGHIFLITRRESHICGEF